MFFTMIWCYLHSPWIVFSTNDTKWRFLVLWLKAKDILKENFNSYWVMNGILTYIRRIVTKKLKFTNMETSNINNIEHASNNHKSWYNERFEIPSKFIWNPPISNLLFGFDVDLSENLQVLI